MLCAQLDHVHEEPNLVSRTDEEHLEEARKQLSLIQRRPDSYEASRIVSLPDACVCTVAA